MSSLKIYKVKRYHSSYSKPYSKKLKLKDQNLYEDVRHMLKRIDYSAKYYLVEVFAAKPFINSNDELEMRWVKLSLEDIQAIRDQCAADALDKASKKR